MMLVSASLRCNAFAKRILAALEASTKATQQELEGAIIYIQLTYCSETKEEESQTHMCV